jgi:hypothetical protein
MAEPAEPATPLLLVQDGAAGYCDPETGVCALPDASDAGPRPDAERQAATEPEGAAAGGC